MPYKLSGTSVVRSDTGAVVKKHPTREKALKHLRALKANVEEGVLGTLLEGFSEQLHPRGWHGRFRPGDRVRVSLKGGSSIVGRVVRPADAQPESHVVIAPESRGPHVIAAVKNVKLDTPERHAQHQDERAREYGRQALERGQRPAGGRDVMAAAAQAQRTREEILRKSPGAEREAAQYRETLSSSRARAIRDSEPRSPAGRPRVRDDGRSGPIAPSSPARNAVPRSAMKWQADPGGKVHRLTVGRHKLKAVKQNTAAGGPRWKVYHSDPRGTERIAAKGDYLENVKRDAEQRLREGAHEGIAVLVEAFAVVGTPVTPTETPQQSMQRGAQDVKNAQDFNSKHPRAGGGKFASKGGRAAKAKHGRKQGKRATRASSKQSRTLTVGSKGPLVRAVQLQLHVPASGTYDAATANAVRQFQQQHGLLPDGIVGAQTLAALRGGGVARPGPIPTRASRIAKPRATRRTQLPARAGGGVVI